MKKWMKKHLKNEKGLTLVELLAVIVILGIIAAIAVPSIGGIIENSRIKAAKADALNAIAAANLYFAENDTEEDVTLEELETEGYMKDLGSLEKANGKVENGEKGSDVKITANATAGKEKVEFKGATVKQINESKNKLVVDGSSPGGGDE